jgi:CDP-glucose 4,6-dehydratase
MRAMHLLRAIDPEFWHDRRVLLTGFSGFKGSWLWLWLEHLGAAVTGLALPPDTSPSMAGVLGLCDRSGAVLGDIRDRSRVRELIDRSDPQIVIHMAAQALVRQGYEHPVDTFDVNVTGTLVLLDALRRARSLQAVLVVTSDKVYENDSSGQRFCEDDRLGGADPYSASKAACELAVASFGRSFFAPSDAASGSVGVATARAGNVIGGGDWSADRIIPDLWRARISGTPVGLRYPDATRPWQHVLDPLCGYLAFARALSEGLDVAALNFGPEAGEVLSVRDLAEAFDAAWPDGVSPGWVQAAGAHPKEAMALAIDSRKAAALLDWRPHLGQRDAIGWTAQWYAEHDRGGEMQAFTLDQIRAYERRIAGREGSLA